MNEKKIEKFIKKHNGEYSFVELWKEFPNGKSKEFTKALDNLIKFASIIKHMKKSNKIVLTGNNKIVWIHNPKLAKFLLKDSIRYEG